MVGKHRARPSRNVAADGDLVADIYEAALEPRLWDTVLNQVALQLGAKTSVLYAMDLTDDALGFRTAAGADPDWDIYDTHYAAVDPFIAGLIGHRTGQVYLLDELTDRRAYVRSEFCSDFMQTMDMFHVIGGLVQQSHRTAMLWGFQRPQKRESFTETDRSALQSLFPHVGRAVALQQRLEQATRQTRDHAEALNLIDTGILRCDGKAHLLYANRVGEAILRDGDALRTAAGMLTAVTPAVTQALRALIGRVAKGDCPSECSLPLPRPGAPPVAAAVSPLTDSPGARTIFGEIEPSVLVMLRDPLRDPEQPVARLQSLFALSPAEARMAWMLTAGKSMQEIAPIEGVTRETARTRLKLIFGKVGVHRQAELVSLLRSSLSR